MNQLDERECTLALDPSEGKHISPGLVATITWCPQRLVISLTPSSLNVSIPLSLSVSFKAVIIYDLIKGSANRPHSCCLSHTHIHTWRDTEGCTSENMTNAQCRSVSVWSIPETKCTNKSYGSTEMEKPHCIQKSLYIFFTFSYPWSDTFCSHCTCIWIDSSKLNAF